MSCVYVGPAILSFFLCVHSVTLWLPLFDFTMPDADSRTAMQIRMLTDWLQERDLSDHNRVAIRAELARLVACDDRKHTGIVSTSTTTLEGGKNPF